MPCKPAEASKLRKLFLLISLRNKNPSKPIKRKYSYNDAVVRILNIAPADISLPLIKGNQMSKPIMNIRQLHDHTGMSISYIYKLTSRGLIPHYKPGGKLIYFVQEEMDKWLLSKKIFSDDETKSETDKFLSTTKKSL